MWDLIEELEHDGTTVLLTTQYLDEADRLAERIVVIDHGHGHRERHVRRAEGPDRRRPDRVSIANGREPRGGDCVPFEPFVHRRRSTIEDDGRSFSAPIRSGDRVVPAVIRALDDAGVDVLDVEVRRPTLDDVFLTLTGAMPPTTRPTEIDIVERLLRDRDLGQRTPGSKPTRHLRIIPRNIELLIFATIQPIMFVILFVYVFGGAIQVPGYASYEQFLMPGHLQPVAGVRVGLHGIGLAEDLQQGPRRPAPVVADVAVGGADRSNSVSDLVRNVITFFVMLAVALLADRVPVRRVAARSRRSPRCCSCCSATRSAGSRR